MRTPNDRRASDARCDRQRSSSAGRESLRCRAAVLPPRHRSTGAHVGSVEGMAPPPPAAAAVAANAPAAVAATNGANEAPSKAADPIPVRWIEGAELSHRNSRAAPTSGSHHLCGGLHAPAFFARALSELWVVESSIRRGERVREGVVGLSEAQPTWRVCQGEGIRNTAPETACHGYRRSPIGRPRIKCNGGEWCRQFAIAAA
eukprot:scaffold7596_cov113-Isochrysis_galbana.AAC.5